MHLFLIFGALVALANSHKVTFDDYKVFKVLVETNDEVQILRKLVESNNVYEFWFDLETAVLVPPNYVYDFLSKISYHNLKYETLIDNVQALLVKEKTGINTNDESFNWTKFQTLEKIYDWLDSLQKKYPKNLEIIIGGSTYEGRQIKGVKISFKKNNPGVFIEGGIHALEWISHATVTYLINEFLTSQDPEVRQLAEAHDWYIFPVVNPDGYFYTHNVNRFWRKNRAPSSANCTGIDLNRNFDFKWATKGGASNDPCHHWYSGKHPFSEIETKTFSSYIKSISDKLFAYIDFHAAAQLLTVPYAYTPEHLDNYNETYAIGVKAVNALARKHGTEYQVGNTAELIYIANGISIDWVKAKFKLPLVYVYELRDKNRGLVPPEEIIPNSEEILDSLIMLFKEAKKYGYPRRT